MCSSVNKYSLSVFVFLDMVLVAELPSQLRGGRHTPLSIWSHCRDVMESRGRNTQLVVITLLVIEPHSPGLPKETATEPMTVTMTMSWSRDQLW